VVGR
jgi:hypothetical protein